MFASAVSYIPAFVVDSFNGLNKFAKNPLKAISDLLSDAFKITQKEPKLAMCLILLACIHAAHAWTIGGKNTVLSYLNTVQGHGPIFCVNGKGIELSITDDLKRIRGITQKATAHDILPLVNEAAKCNFPTGEKAYLSVEEVTQCMKNAATTILFDHQSATTHRVFTPADEVCESYMKLAGR